MTGRRRSRRRCDAPRAGRRKAPSRSPRAAVHARHGSRPGSTTSMRSAIRLSLGSRIASALKPASSELDLSVARSRRRPASASAVFAARARRPERASSVPASPRSGRTDPYRFAPAARARRRLRSASTTIGAEKPRLIDSSGGSVTFSKRNALPGLVEKDQLLRGDLWPLVSPISAVFSGIGIGCLTGWPGRRIDLLLQVQGRGLGRRIMLEPRVHLVACPPGCTRS